MATCMDVEFCNAGRIRTTRNYILANVLVVLFDTDFLYIVAVPMINGITTFVKEFDKTEWDSINVIYFKKLYFINN